MSRTAFGLITSRLSRAISSCSCFSLISLTAASLDLRVNSVFYMIHLGSIKHLTRCLRNRQPNPGNRPSREQNRVRAEKKSDKKL
jgi:hypothetical protein